MMTAACPVMKVGRIGKPVHDRAPPATETRNGVTHRLSRHAIKRHRHKHRKSRADPGGAYTHRYRLASACVGAFAGATSRAYTGACWNLDFIFNSTSAEPLPATRRPLDAGYSLCFTLDDTPRLQLFTAHERSC